MFKNGIGGFLQLKGLEEGNKILVPDLLQHAKLLNALRRLKLFYYNNLVRRGFSYRNSRENFEL